MRLLSSFLLFTTSITALLVTPDDIIQDVSNINNGVLANEQATEEFDGSDLVTSLVDGVSVLATVSDIHIANRKGYVDANLSDNLSEDDTALIFQYVADTVALTIPDSIQILESKKSEFDEAGQSSIVLASLELLLNDHDTFSAAVQAKAYQGNDTLTQLGDETTATIHDAIQGGIDTYSS